MGGKKVANRVDMVIAPCKLCGGEAKDKSFGIQCSKCGLWLGDNSSHASLGMNYREIWNGKYKGEIGD